MNKNDYNSNDKKSSSLTDMINEYDNDSALRNKIEAVRKQKEMEEEAKRQAEIQRRLDEIEQSKQAAKNEPVKPSIEETTEIPPMVAPKPFISADEEVTQVFSADEIKEEEDVDKTLVIMDNMKQRNFSNEEPTPAFTQSAYSDPIPTPKVEETERLAPEFEVNDEEITEKDIEEYLPEDSKPKKKKKKSSDPDKMNKTITYVIAGVAGLCVIGMIVFALNFFGILGGSDNKTLKLDEVTVDDKVNMEEIGANNFTIKGSEVEKITDTALITMAKAEAKSTEDGTKVQVTTVDKSALKAEKGTYKVSFSTKKGTKVTVKATVSASATDDKDKDKDNKEEESNKDNSAKINELEGQIKVNEGQIETLKADIATYQNTIDSVGEEKAKIDNGYAEQLEKAQREYNNAEGPFNTANSELEAAKATGDAKKIADAQKKYDTAYAAYQTASDNLGQIQAEISDKKNAIDAAVNNASNAISSCNQQIMDLQNEIISLQNQLSALKG